MIWLCHAPMTLDLINLMYRQSVNEDGTFPHFHTQTAILWHWAGNLGLHSTNKLALWYGGDAQEWRGQESNSGHRRVNSYTIASTKLLFIKHKKLKSYLRINSPKHNKEAENWKHAKYRNHSIYSKTVKISAVFLACRVKYKSFSIYVRRLPAKALTTNSHNCTKHTSC